jgi:hypothetical protein
MVDKVEPKDLPPAPAGKTNQKPVAESETPLGGPPALPTGTGPYRFIAMRPDADAPVAYDPCRFVTSSTTRTRRRTATG